MNKEPGSLSPFEHFVQDFWDYYRELENDFLNTRKFVAFEKGNFKTYSIEYLKLFQAVCSEIDVLGKAMALAVNPSLKKKQLNNIQRWWLQVQDRFRIYRTPFDAANNELESGTPLYNRSEVCVGRFDITPWKNFRIMEYTNAEGHRCCRLTKDSSTPSWWTAYNKVKHERIFAAADANEGINFAKANLGNLVNAFAALYILEIAYMQFVGTQDDLEAFADYSRLFADVQMATSSEIDALFNVK